MPLRGHHAPLGIEREGALAGVEQAIAGADAEEAVAGDGEIERAAGLFELPLLDPRAQPRRRFGIAAGLGDRLEPRGGGVGDVDRDHVEPALRAQHRLRRGVHQSRHAPPCVALLPRRARAATSCPLRTERRATRSTRAPEGVAPFRRVRGQGVRLCSDLGGDGRSIPDALRPCAPSAGGGRLRFSRPSDADHASTHTRGAASVRRPATSSATSPIADVAAPASGTAG